MKFYSNQLFHIYNQGNNQQTVFFDTENYHFFLWKMRMYLPPFGDLIAWCLMPNHFHWLFYVKYQAVKRSVLREHLDRVEYQRRLHKYGTRARAVTYNDNRTSPGDQLISLNDTIGDLLKGYTSAVNKSLNRTGSLWRGECKAKEDWIDAFVTVKDKIHFQIGNDYAYQCLRYIHANATMAGLVQKDVEYEWSSARDYAGLRNGSLCNLEMGRQIMDYVN